MAGKGAYPNQLGGRVDRPSVTQKPDNGVTDALVEYFFGVSGPISLSGTASGAGQAVGFLVLVDFLLEGTASGAGQALGTLVLIAPSPTQAVITPFGGRRMLPEKPRRPNENDRALEEEAEEARAVVRSWTQAGPGFGAGISGVGGLAWRNGPGGGLGSMGGLGDLGPNELPGYNSRRFDNASGPERLARAFAKRGRVTTPAIIDGDVTVIDYTVPMGYWCRIQQLSCTYSGTGFVDGSGDLEWRLLIGSVYARNMGRILFELGTPSCAFPISDYIGVRSGRRVRMIVRTINASGNIQVGASLILCAVLGYMIPAGKPVGERIRGGGS